MILGTMLYNNCPNWPVCWLFWWSSHSRNVFDIVISLQLRNIQCEKFDVSVFLNETLMFLHRTPATRSQSDIFQICVRLWGQSLSKIIQHKQQTDRADIVSQSLSYLDTPPPQLQRYKAQARNVLKSWESQRAGAGEKWNYWSEKENISGFDKTSITEFEQ